MSGECNLCGEHTLECGCGKQKLPGPNDKFYYQGKLFQNEDEFWAYVKEVSLRQTTEEDFNSLFDMLKKDIWINLSIRKTKLSNGELRSIFEDIFMTILEKCWGKNGMDQR